MASLIGVRIVPEVKLASYLLEVNHPEGGSKARFFRARGFSPDDLRTFETAILLHASAHPVYAERHHKHGINRVIRCEMVTPDEQNPCVNTVWMQSRGTTSQRFVTAYPA